MAIAQGSTPYLLLTVEGYDLSEAASIMVTIKDRDSKYSFGDDRLTVAYADETSVVTLHLTQAESIALYPVTVQIQLRWRDTAGEAYTTDIQTISVSHALYKGVI